MRTRPSILIAALAALVISVHVSAQEGLPPARTLVDRFVAATGEKDVMAKHTSRRAVGHISMPAQGVEGDVEILSARPNLMRLRMTIPGVGEIQSGYDGKTGWSVNPLTGPMLMQGRSFDQMKADSDFDVSLHPDTIYKSLETVEKTTFEGRPAYKVRALRVTGEEDLEFFDVENGLMLGAIVTRESPMGPMKATHVNSDYKDFGGVKMASKITQRLMGTEQVITIAEVEYDKVDKSAFVPPAQIQALIK